MWLCANIPSLMVVLVARKIFSKKISLSVKRWEVVFLSEHRLGPKLPPSAVARTVGCSVKTVQNLLDCYHDTGDVQAGVSSGRPRVTSKKQDESVVKIAKKDGEASSGAIAEKLKGKGVVVTARTVRRRLEEARFEYSAPPLKPLLSEHHQQARLAWATEHTDFDWDT
jgi:transposase